MFRFLQHYIPKSLAFLAIAEILILLVATLFGVELYIAFDSSTGISSSNGLFQKALLFACVIFAAMMATGLYWIDLKEGMWGKLLRIALGFLGGITGLTLLFHMFPELSFESDIFLGITGIGFMGILIVRGIYYFLSEQGALKRHLLVLGAGEKARQLDELDWTDVKLVGYIPTQGQQNNVDSRKLLLTNKSLYETVKDYHVEEIVVALDDRRKKFPVSELLECKMKGIKVVDSTRFLEAHTGKIRINETNASIVIFSEGFHRSRFSNYIKRAFDVGISLLLLILSSPIMLLTAFAIFFTSQSHEPIFYRQVRVGKNGSRFSVLKFRTMHVDAEKDGKARWADKNDPRVTRIGRILRKSRLDELPQLINVIKGEMSFVGPRPERPEFVEFLSTQIPYYNLRNQVKPGITGWAQISYPYGSTVQDAAEKLQYDFYYIKNYSMLLDLNILLQTVHTVLWGRGGR